MDACRRRFRRRAVATLLGGLLLSSSGCALVPTWDDIHSTTSLVKDTMSGKTRRDRQTQMFAEARIMERRKDFAGAEKLYRELLAEQPKSRDCYHRLGVMAAMQSKFDEANTHYQAALACGEPTADLWNDVGYNHYLQHQLPEAQGALERAVALTPQHRSALNNLALVAGEQGRMEDSYRLFRQGNGEAEAEANFAYLCAQSGDFTRAQVHYSRALSIDPTMKPAVEALLQVTQRMQLIQDEQVRQASVGAADATGGVKTAGHEVVGDVKPAPRLMEVYTATPSRKAATALAAEAVANASAADAAAAAAAPGATPPLSPPTFGSPVPPQPIAGGATLGAPQPFSFPSQPQPGYLQPSSIQPNEAAKGASATSAHPVMNAGGPFPPLVGGSSAIR